MSNDHGMPNEPRPDDLLGTAEVCALFGGLDKSTVVRWVQTGRLIPAHKMPGASGAYLFRRSDVEALRDARAKTPEDEPEPNGAEAVA